ncbi:uncharacterized protein KZ484_015105 [Pholidichthys leucotaenia]
MAEGAAAWRWSREAERTLIKLWQEHPCLFDVSNPQYHNRAEKEKAWREVAGCLHVGVEEVKTRAVSLRTQYSRLIKPKPSGSRSKPLTPRQKWLLRVMAFIRRYIVHRPSESTTEGALSEQGEADNHLGSSELSPTHLSTFETPSPTPSASTLCSDSLFAPIDDSDFPADVPQPITKKRKKRSENDIEVQKLGFLKQMAARIEGDPPDACATFGNQVASEMRLIQDQVSVTRLKRNIMNMIYDVQDDERRRDGGMGAAPVRTGLIS